MKKASSMLVLLLLFFACCMTVKFEKSSYNNDGFPDETMTWSKSIPLIPFMDIDKSAFNTAYDYGRKTKTTETNMSISQGDISKISTDNQVRAVASTVSMLRAIMPILPDLLGAVSGIQPESVGSDDAR